MFTLSETRTFSLGAESYVTRSYVSSETALTVRPVVPAALAGTLSTRTSDTDGIATLAVAPAAIAVGDLLDLYFAGGALVNALVVAVAGADVTFTAEVSDPVALPVEGSAVALSAPVVVPLAFDGDDALGYAVKGASTAAARVAFLDTAYAELLAVDLGAGEGKAWSSATADPNPLGGAAVASARFSHGDTKERTLSVTVLTG